MSQRLGDLLVKEKVITPEQLSQAVKLQKETNCRLGTALVKLNFLSDEDVTNFLSKQYGVPAINLSYFEIDPAVVKLIPADTARRYQILPLSRVGASLTIAMADPTNVFAMDDIKFMTGFNIEPVVASESSIAEGIEKAYSEREEENLETVMQSMAEIGDADVELQAEEQQMELADLERAADEAPIVKLVNIILSDAVKRGASDIHMEPYEKEFRVRFRMDGVLQSIMSPPLKLKDAIISRVKIMAKLDISEKRLPQDGRIMLKMNVGGRKKTLDFRVSTLPTLWGEKIVLRLLDKENLRLDMTKLGFEPESLVKFEKAILKPYGMVLVTGPTGSGKTNTLYSSIARLNTPETNIMTAEDPVEFQLAGVNQVQMKEQIGLNFAAALRAFLRQDPNIILVGEIRDFETAEIAIKAAQTGHLVMSTLHTNDAPQTLTRLVDMGVKPYAIATSVSLIIAQRLARRLCSHCKQPIDIPREALIKEGFAEADIAGGLRLYTPKGCQSCTDGYKGRVGIYQVLPVTDSIARIILAAGSAVDISDQASKEGVWDLRRAGLEKVKAGLTSLEEVNSVTTE